MFKWNGDDAIVLPIALAIIILSATLYSIFLSKNERLRRLPLRCLAVLIVLLEISKQLVYIFWVPYNNYALPLHFCSTFIWLMPLAQFTRGKAAKFFKPMPFVYSFFVVILLYAYPRVLLGNATSKIFGDFFTSHTLLFHHTIVAYCVFSIALKDFTPCKSDIFSLVAGILFYAIYAVPAAYALNVNYVNILQSDFPPLEALRLNAGKVGYVFGQTVYNIILFAVSVLSALGIWAIIFFFAKKKGKKSVALVID